MAAERSEACPIPSRKGGGWLSQPQALAESMCIRMAAKDGKDLGNKFWSREPMKRTFLIQLRLAVALLKLASYKAICNALRTKEGRKIYSLGASWLFPLVMEEQRKLDEQEVRVRLERESSPRPEPSLLTQPEPPRPVFTLNKSLLSRLEDLD